MEPRNAKAYSALYDPSKTNANQLRYVALAVKAVRARRIVLLRLVFYR